MVWLPVSVCIFTALMFNMCCSGDCEAHTLALVSQCFYSHKIAAEVDFFLSHKPHLYNIYFHIYFSESEYFIKN